MCKYLCMHCFKYWVRAGTSDPVSLPPLKLISVLLQLPNPDQLGGPHPNKYFSDFATKVGTEFFSEIFSEKNELITKCDKTSEEHRNEGPIQLEHFFSKTSSLDFINRWINN